MLIRKKKTKKNQTQKPEQMAYDPNLGSGWVPGVSDGSWLLPDSARNLRFRRDIDGVWRPQRRD
jgi:hypothetical protein